MKTTKDFFTLEVTATDKVCAIGEQTGRKLQNEGKIPVFSCEGACIKGEIARLAANLVAKEDQYARACHGALFSIPHSGIADWIRKSDKVVVIDGCSLHCHGRIAENIINKEKLVKFDGLSLHRKYASLMEVDEVPESERRLAARELADKILANLDKNETYSSEIQAACGCGEERQTKKEMCGLE